MKHFIVSLLVVALFHGGAVAQKRYSLVSPDGRLNTEVTVGKQIEYAVSHEGDQLLVSSPLSMQLADGTLLGVDARISGAKSKSVNSEIQTVNYKKNVVADQYNELDIRFKGNYRLVFRAYNEGVAYRFVTDMKNPFVVTSEQVQYNSREVRRCMFLT